MRWLRHWGPAIVWAAFIWFLSTHFFTAGSTSHVIIPILRWLLPHASPELLEGMHIEIRKTGHFVEYFILSLLVLRGVRGDRKGWHPKWGLAVVVIVACYALLDEVHQAFVPMRTASPYDSLLDSSGAVVAQLVAWLRALRQARDPGKPA
ncbi:MAG: VanZ family protein [Acidobacteria bacterium]|nr:VanZ family protein [Acidobacteriota bacterium]